MVKGQVYTQDMGQVHTCIYIFADHTNEDSRPVKKKIYFTKYKRWTYRNCVNSGNLKYFFCINCERKFEKVMIPHNLCLFSTFEKTSFFLFNSSHFNDNKSHV